VTAILVGLAVAAVALTVAFTVLLSSWWVRDRRRRRLRVTQRLRNREDVDRADRQQRLRVTYVAPSGRPRVW
jgi:hypothetical protein